MSNIFWKSENLMWIFTILVFSRARFQFDSSRWLERADRAVWTDRKILLIFFLTDLMWEYILVFFDKSYMELSTFRPSIFVLCLTKEQTENLRWFQMSYDLLCFCDENLCGENTKTEEFRIRFFKKKRTKTETEIFSTAQRARSTPSSQWEHTYWKYIVKKTKIMKIHVRFSDFQKKTNPHALRVQIWDPNSFWRPRYLSLKFKTGFYCSSDYLFQILGMNQIFRPSTENLKIGVWISSFFSVKGICWDV